MNKAFWIAIAKRALHTMAQVALGMIPVAVRIESVDWIAVLSTAALAGVVSVLKSIVIGVPEASFNEETTGGDDDEA